MRPFLVLLFGAASLWAAPGSKPLSDEAKAVGTRFTDSLQNITTSLAREYVKPISLKEYYTTALKALYRTAHQEAPPTLLDDVRQAKDDATLRAILIHARASLHPAPELAYGRDLFAALSSYTSILDPASVLFPTSNMDGTPTIRTYGMELEGEAIARGRGRRPREEDGPDPVARDNPPALPFRVVQVKPGSPAQKAGVRPGDHLLQIDDIKADVHTAGQAFAALHQPRDERAKHTLLVERSGNAKPFPVTLVNDDFTPESLFGVKRQKNNEWDYWIDRDAGLAYVRLGAIESDSGDLLGTILHDLRDVKGLLFDLRWCPGGYIDAATQIASTFLESGLIAKMSYRNPSRGSGAEIRADGGLVRYKAGDYPLLILMNGETTGGGELIAAALRDNERATLAGTRSVGKTTISWPETIHELPGYSFRLTGGNYTRPNGKNMQRYPTSKPTDDWGLRPDAGYTIPASADLAKKLKEMHTLYALRPGHSREALDLDDPDTDPQRVRAVKLLREMVRKKK